MARATACTPIFTDLADLDCTVASVALLYDGTEFSIAPVSEGSSVYTGVIPADTVIASPNGQVVLEVTCEDETTHVLVGTIVLYDPSGIVSDAATGEPDAEIDLGERVNPASPEISPNVNPFLTNEIGY